MKISKIFSLLSIAAIAGLASCSNEEPNSNPVTADDEVNFAIGTGKTSRTMYGPESSDGTSQTLWWGNYLNWENAVYERVTIFSPDCAAGRNQAEYKITPTTGTIGTDGYGTGSTTPTGGSNTAGSLDKTGDYGVQWGNNESGKEKFDFYALFPSMRWSNIATSGSNYVATANISNGQWPKQFTTITDGGVTTWRGEPDMQNCLMIAHNNAQAYAETVTLGFEPIATVLDVTVSAPSTTNTIQAFRDGMTINRIILRSTDGANITGSFQYNITTGQMVGSISEGSDMIQMVIVKPTYASDAEHTSSSSPVTIKKGEKLSVRFFIAPDPTIKPENLQLEVYTNAGYYIKKLASNSIEPKQINKIKLPAIEQPGVTINYNYWMSDIDPNTYITELSIPGSWAATNGICQTKSMQEQFEAGIRAFNVSVAWNTTDIDNTVGDNTGSITLAKLLSDLNTWLQEEKNKFNGENFNEFVVLNIATNFHGETQNITNALTAADNIAKVVNAATNIQQNITANTTISDVAGKIIVHCNATDPILLNQTQASTVTQAPILYSYWWTPSSTTNLTYYNQPRMTQAVFGKPMFDYISGNSLTNLTEDASKLADAPMRWYYYEFGRMVTTQYEWGSTLSLTQQAVQNMALNSYNYYTEGKHNVWIYMVIGDDQATGSNTSNVTTINDYTYNQLTNPSRQTSPYGMIMMNNADESNQKLIDAIMWNNYAFHMQTSTGGTTQQSAPHNATRQDGGNLADWD